MAQPEHALGYIRIIKERYVCELEYKGYGHCQLLIYAAASARIY